MKPVLLLLLAHPALAQGDACSSAGMVAQCSPCKGSTCTVLAQEPAADPVACCQLCAAKAGCQHWTFNAKEASKGTPCHLKAGEQGEYTSGNCTSSAPAPAGPTPPPTPAPGPDPSKHNILFLMSDSMDGRVLDPTSPVYKRLEMPNLRKLAAQGANFIRTYAAAPQCVPSRTTMFAGRHTHEIKAWSNSQGVAGVPGKDWGTTAGIDPVCIKSYDLPTCTAMARAGNVTHTILDSLRDSAFEPHLYGKVDVGAGILSDWDEGNATCDGYHGGPILPISARAADIQRATKGRPTANEDDNNVHPEDWKMVPRCIEFLQDVAARTARGAPMPKQFATEASSYENWMLYCSINIPHPAFQTNATWLKYVHDDLVAPPPTQPVGAMHPYDTFMSSSKSTLGSFTADEVVQVRRTYYAMCAETDFLLGRVLDALRATGQYERTFVVFLSDHGEMNMEHRQQLKNSMYEPSSRVPMMVAGPGIAPNQQIANLTSLLDVFPTLVEMAGGDVRELTFLQGQSLFPLMAPGSAAAPAAYPADRAVAAQYHSNMGNTGSYMVRWRNWKYIAFGHTFDTFSILNGYSAQLFDVDADPDEMNDVASLPANRATVSHMDSLLRAQLGDIDAIDREVMTNDKAIYQNYFVAKFTPDALRKKFEKAFKGFDDSDMAKVEAWNNTSV